MRLHSYILEQMKQTKEIKIEEYNYPLPDERIAKFPLPKRDTSKLLLYRHGEIEEHTFNQIDNYIPEQALMVFNNTKVIQARMHFTKDTGAVVEIFCLEPYAPNDYALVFQQTERCTWVCLVGNSKRWKSGLLQQQLQVGDKQVTLSAERIQNNGESNLVEFTWDNTDVTFAEILDAFGELPIPPYLKRDTEESDLETYQTVYSKVKGSVAAPTAGLHFTPEVFEALKKKHVTCEEVTLHVGAGTFKPVKSELIQDHEMHTEFISVNKATIENLLHKLDCVIAVGTTSVRTIESLYFVGAILEANPNAQPAHLKVTQWMPYEGKLPTIPAQKALQNILDYLSAHKLDKLMTNTQIMIAPGYSFKIVRGIVTNFHQPQSTLLLLISAFVDGNWKPIYDYALAHDFRFLSYGDSSLLLR